jgi:hypothetical protein
MILMLVVDADDDGHQRSAAAVSQTVEKAKRALLINAADRASAKRELGAVWLTTKGRLGLPVDCTPNFRGSQPLNPFNRGDRDNCFRSVIRFSSRAEKATSRYVCKVLSLQVLSKLHESCTKGNIQPCKSLRFQEKLEIRAVFAFSRTAATTRTPQTKDSRYPVFIRGNRGCYQNN